jgi:glycosyltransferase involved in cell wall biosynthesis
MGGSMKRNTGRVLVVSHEAQLTGAPRVAVEIVRSLGAGDAEVDCVLRAGGPLAGEFAAAADRVVTEPLPRARALLKRWRPLRTVAHRLDELVALLVLARLRPAVAYLNTVKSGCYVRPALRLGIPVVLHAHETGALAETTLRRYPVGRRWNEVRLVACSTAARDDLARVVEVPAARIGVVHSPVDVDLVAERARSPEDRPAPQAPFVVGACGSVNEGKGTDLWLEMARAVRDRRPDQPILFRWVGGRRGNWPDDIAHGLGVDDVVEFTGSVANPHPLLAGTDVFTLPSRGDAFPLVVLEAMTHGRPIVAFDVGGVREQVGDAGVVVPPADPEAMADAVVALLDDRAERERLGAEAQRRVRSLYGMDRFRARVRGVVDSIVEEARHDRRPSAFLLKYWEAGDAKVQNYRIETLAQAGVDLDYSDAAHKAPWTSPPVHRAVRRLERLGAPFLQTLLATRRIARSDAVVAVFESQGNFLAALRSLRLWPYTRPRFAVVSCWLAMDAPKLSPARRRAYRWAYRGVDKVVYFSRNQTSIYRDVLGIPEDHLAFVPFGIDHEYFSPPATDDDDGYVLAVGRDRGRDWETLFDAVHGTDLVVKVASRPDNVELLGFVDRPTYRSLTARARVVAVPTRVLAYPTGQSVTLEAMAMGKCCVVTDTPAMSDYLTDGVDAVLVPPGDSGRLREALEQAVSDPDLRKRTGFAAREAVDRQFNAPAMWRAIAEVVLP